MVDCINFKPGPELTFNSVVRVRSQISDALKGSTKAGFCLDLGDVRHCDSAGLALLIDAKKLCQASNKVFEVKGISKATQSLAEFCGVESILETT